MSEAGLRVWSDEGFQEETIQYKPQVHPVFLAYQSNQDGPCITLFQIASSVAQAVGGSILDVVQPMCSGWFIYMQIQADRDLLIQRGLVVAGRYVTLHSEVAPR